MPIHRKTHQGPSRRARRARVLTWLGGIFAGSAVGFRAGARARGRGGDAALAQGVEDAHGLVAAARAAVITVDARGAVTSWNPAAAEIFGHSATGAVGRVAEDLLFMESQRAPYRTLVDDVARHGSPAAADLAAVAADGRALTIGVTVAPLPGGGVAQTAIYARDITQEVRVERGRAVLARTSELLNSSADYERTLQQVASLAVPDLADWCGVDIPGSDGLPMPVAIAHAQDDRLELARELRRRYPVTEADAMTHVMRTGESFLQPDVPDEAMVAYANDDDHLALLRAVGFRSLMVVPLKAGRRTIGAMTFVGAESARRFDESDLALAQELAQRAGTAVENARLSEERARITQTLLASLRPPQLPPIDGWETATLYRPAERSSEVGGDFYDVFAVSDGWMLVIGDVVGKGPTAAALTSLARWSIRTAATLTGSPGRALAHVNADLDRESQAGQLSALCVLLRDAPPGATATVASGGHPLPVLVGDGRAELVGEHSLLLGVRAEAEFAEVTVDLGERDTLVLYTDGVLDTAGAAGRFGEERLLDALRQSSGGASAVVSRLEAELAAFRRGSPSDDVAVLAVSRDAAAVNGHSHAATS